MIMREARTSFNYPIPPAADWTSVSSKFISNPLLDLYDQELEILGILLPPYDGMVR